MLEDAKTLVFIKDFTGDGSTRYFLKTDQVPKEISAAELGKITTPVICHDFWLIKDELGSSECLPIDVFDIDEVKAIVSQKRNLREQRDRQNISLKMPADLIASETMDAYIDMIERRLPVDLSVLKAACSALTDYARQLISLAEQNDELTRLREVELPAFNMLASHSSIGIGIDSDRVREARETIQFDFYSALKAFSQEFDLQPDVLRDDQLHDFVDEKGLDRSEVSLNYIVEYIPIEGNFGPKLQELRKLRDTNSILNDLSLSTDRAFPIVDTFGTRTSRIVFRNPALQNLAKRYRDVIVPLDGKMLGYVDYDQFEVGIMAALSGDADLKELYASGDMYDLFAREYLKIDGFRKQAKLLFLSYAYGMGRKAVIDAAVELGADRQDAKAAFRRFETYEVWKRLKESEFDQNGKVSTLLGNYIIGEGSAPFSRKERRSMISQIVQGAGSLIFKKALLKLRTRQDFRLVLPMHDAMLFEYEHDSTPSLVVHLMKEAMTSALNSKVKGKASISDFFEP